MGLGIAPLTGAVARPVVVAESVAARRRRPRLLREALLGAAVVLVLHLFFVQISVVRGHSMEPCLHDGDRLVIDRLACSLSGIDRFDVVVLRNPRDQTVDYVKRVIGLPGDHVRLVDGDLIVNGERVREFFGPIHDDATTREVVVPAGSLWVLGDNRPVSCDSREFGLVDIDLVRGTVRARFWPPDRLTLW